MGIQPASIAEVAKRAGVSVASPVRSSYDILTGKQGSITITAV